MNHQRFGIAHVGKVAGQLEAVDEANCIVVATVEGEHQHASHPAACQVFLRGSVVRITGQTGIAHMGNGGMGLQPGGMVLVLNSGSCVMGQKKAGMVLAP